MFRKDLASMYAEAPKRRWGSGINSCIGQAISFHGADACLLLVHSAPYSPFRPMLLELCIVTAWFPTGFRQALFEWASLQLKVRRFGRKFDWSFERYVVLSSIACLYGTNDRCRDVVEKLRSLPKWIREPHPLSPSVRPDKTKHSADAFWQKSNFGDGISQACSVLAYG